MSNLYYGMSSDGKLKTLTSLNVNLLRFYEQFFF